MNEDDWDAASADTRVLAKAIEALVQGDVHGPGGIESIVMALTGRDISDRESLPYQISTALGGVASAIDNLADAYRERTRRLC